VLYSWEPSDTEVVPAASTSTSNSVPSSSTRILIFKSPTYLIPFLIRGSFAGSILSRNFFMARFRAWFVLPHDKNFVLHLLFPPPFPGVYFSTQSLGLRSFSYEDSPEVCVSSCAAACVVWVWPASADCVAAAAVLVWAGCVAACVPAACVAACVVWAGCVAPVLVCCWGAAVVPAGWVASEPVCWGEAVVPAGWVASVLAACVPAACVPGAAVVVYKSFVFRSYEILIHQIW